MIISNKYNQRAHTLTHSWYNTMWADTIRQRLWWLQAALPTIAMLVVTLLKSVMPLLNQGDPHSMWQCDQ